MNNFIIHRKLKKNWICDIKKSITSKVATLLLATGVINGCTEKEMQLPPYLQRVDNTPKIHEYAASFIDDNKLIFSESTGELAYNKIFISDLEKKTIEELEELGRQIWIRGDTKTCNGNIVFDYSFYDLKTKKTEYGIALISPDRKSYIRIFKSDSSVNSVTLVDYFEGKIYAMDINNCYEITPDGITPPKKFNNFSELPKVIQEREDERVRLLHELSMEGIRLLDYTVDKNGYVDHVVGKRGYGLYRLDYKSYKRNKNKK